MKFNKMVHIFCAGCLLLTTISISGAAAHTDGEFLSAYAGQTVNCQVISLDDGTSDIVSVKIPANATQTEENALVMSAVTGQAEPRVARGLPSISDFTNVRVYASTGNEDDDTLVGSGIAHSDMKTVYVAFNRPIPYNGAVTANVRVYNKGTNTTKYGNFKIATVTTHVAFTSNTLGVRNGDLVTAYATTDAGYMTSDLCQFYGTPS